MDQDPLLGLRKWDPLEGENKVKFKLTTDFLTSREDFAMSEKLAPSIILGINFRGFGKIHRFEDNDNDNDNATPTKYSCCRFFFPQGTLTLWQICLSSLQRNPQ